MMMRVRLFVVLALLVLLSGCAHNWGNFRRVSAERPSTAKEVGPRVTGESCRYFIGKWFWNSIAAATRDALLKAPGATGLADVTVRNSLGFASECIVVEGTPVK